MAQDASGFEPEVVVLSCQYSVARDADLRDAEKEASGFNVKFIMLPCSSKAEVSHILKVLEKGADAVQVIGCPEGLCRFLVGNVRADKRISYAKGLLEQINMGADRLDMQRGEAMAAKDLLAIAEKRANAVRELGPNPMKEGSEK